MNEQVLQKKPRLVTIIKSFYKSHATPKSWNDRTLQVVTTVTYIYIHIF